MSPTPLGLLYRGSRLVLRTSVHAFYDVHVARAHRIPASGPTIFASNHPNSLLDPLVIGAVVPRKLHFLARSGLFTGPRAAFLRAMGAIPVYRRQDGGDTSGNQSAFAACFDVLGQGGAIGIFPEGHSHTDRQLKEIKTGAARIALEAEDRHGFKLGLRLVPVGLSFQNAPRLRSRVTVNFGTPVDLSPWRESYAADPRKAAEELTEHLEEVLATLIVHIEKLELGDVVRDVERIFTGELLREGSAPEERLEVAQEIARAVHVFMAREPDRATRLARRIRRYLSFLDRVGLQDELIRRRKGDVRLTRESMRLGVVGAVLAPVAVYGLVVNYVPIRAAYWSGRLLAPTPSVVATARFFAGLMGVLLTWPPLLYLVFKRSGLDGAVAFGVSLPMTGWVAVMYPRIFGAHIDRIRSAVLRKTRRRSIAKLRTQRSRIVSELTGLRDEYLELRTSPATSSGGPSRT